jgi:hypothetical protein
LYPYEPTRRRLKPEIRVRAQHLKTKGMLRHATVKTLLDD